MVTLGLALQAPARALAPTFFAKTFVLVLTSVPESLPDVVAKDPGFYVFRTHAFASK